MGGGGEYGEDETEAGRTERGPKDTRFKQLVPVDVPFPFLGGGGGAGWGKTLTPLPFLSETFRL